MRDITKNMSRFRKLLRDSLPITEEIRSWNKCPEQFLHNFAEVAWELLLERTEYVKEDSDQMCERRKSAKGFKRDFIKLLPYGRGADFYEQSQRVTYPEVEATHEVVCFPKKGLNLFDKCRGKEFSLTEDENFSFDCFGTWQPNGRGFEFVEMASPLDCLRCSVNGVVRVVDAKECRYYLREGRQ